MLKFTFGEERIELDAGALWPLLEKQLLSMQQDNPTMAFLLKGFLATVIFPPLTKAMSRPGARVAPPNLRSPAAQANMLLYMVGYVYMLMMAMGEADTWVIEYDIEDRDDGPVTHITGLATTLPTVDAALEAVLGPSDQPALPAGGESAHSI